MKAYPPKSRYLTPFEFSDSKNPLKSGKRSTLAIAVVQLPQSLQLAEPFCGGLRPPVLAVGAVASANESNTHGTGVQPWRCRPSLERFLCFGDRLRLAIVLSYAMSYAARVFV